MTEDYIKSLSISEKVAVGEEIWATEHRLACKRRGNLGKGKGTVRDIVGKAVGWSGYTYALVRKVFLLAEANDISREDRQLVRQVIELMDKTDQVEPHIWKISHLTGRLPKGKPLTIKQRRVKLLRKLASTGHRAEQIAEKIGVTVNHTRCLARENGISLPDPREYHPNFNSNKIVREAVLDAEHLAASLRILEIDPDELDQGEIPGWVESLGASISDLRKLLNTLNKRRST